MKGNWMRTPKYKNTKCVFDGHKFDSLKERARYQHLKALERVGEITQLHVHPSFTFEAKGIVVRIKGDQRTTRARYVADFSYCTKSGQKVIEDVKSKFTAKDKYFRLKRAIFEALFDVEISIVI